MTIEERIKLVLRKHSDTRYSRGKFMWAYMCEFYGVNIYALRHQFLSFWADEANIERKLRDILKEKEFKPEPEADSKRYSKASEFKLKLSPKNRKDYEKIFEE